MCVCVLFMYICTRIGIMFTIHSRLSLFREQDEILYRLICLDLWLCLFVFVIYHLYFIYSQYSGNCLKEHLYKTTASPKRPFTGPPK